MDVEFFPRKELAKAFRKGWRLIPGHESRPGDWAILLHRPEPVAKAPAEDMEAWAARFRDPEPRPVLKNTVAANMGRFKHRATEAAA